jgi:hypothetical protein
MNYPDNWLCTCGHEKWVHGSLPQLQVQQHACLLQHKLEGGTLMYDDNCTEFNPIDNLTFVEEEAKRRNAIS